jgi:hypothetical protein
VKRRALLSVLAAFVGAPGSAAGRVPQAQLLEHGRDVGDYSLAANGAGARVVALPLDFAPPPTRLDVFSANAGSPFGPPDRIPGPGVPNLHATAAVAPDATVAIVGVPVQLARDDPRSVVALVRPPGSPFTGPEAVSGPGADTEPSVAFDSWGNATAIWVRGDYVEESTRPNGGDWSAPTAISRERRGASAPKVEFDAAGNSVAVWSRSSLEGANRVLNGAVVAAIRPRGGLFGPPRVVSDPRFDSSEPSLSVNAAGQAAIVWVSNTQGDKHFRLGSAFRQPGRAFGRPRFFTPSRADASGASVALDPRGGALITWRLSAAGAGFRIEAAARRPGGPVGRSVTLSGPGADGAQIARSPAGRFVVSWVYRGSHGDVVQARAATARGKYGRLIQVARRGSLDGLQSIVDDSGLATFAWRRSARGGERLEVTTRAIVDGEN